MFLLRTTLVIALLLHFAIAGFAQSNSQSVNITQGSSVKFQANSIGSSTYQWIKDGIPIPNAVAKIYNASVAGKYSVITFNAEGCESKPSAPVEVIVVPPNTSISADMAIVKTSDNKGTTINDVFEYQLNLKNNAPNTAHQVFVQDVLPFNLTLSQIVTPLIGVADYDQEARIISWRIPKMDSNTVANLKIKVKADKYGRYKNTATVTANEYDPNLSNNTSTHIKYIYGFTIPNVFTPNGDGKNDTFEIPGLSLYDTNELSIVNRWGSSVYEKKGYQNDWTAYGLADGTYFYVLRVKDDTLVWQEFKGYVTVVR